MIYAPNKTAIEAHPTFIENNTGFKILIINCTLCIYSDPCDPY